MKQFINNSFLDLDAIYRHYRWLNSVLINDYQLFTVLWNLILVLMPLGFYFLLNEYWVRTGLAGWGRKIVAAGLFFLWLLFFPNAAYIITDLRHLLNYCPVDSPFSVCRENAWMIMFFFTYASLGWVSFYYLLRQMSALIGRWLNHGASLIFIALAIPLTSLGVLLGLLNRFNSLDAVLYPKQFILAVNLYFFDQGYFINWLIFTIFLYLLYFMGNVIFRKV